MSGRDRRYSPHRIVSAARSASWEMPRISPIIVTSVIPRSCWCSNPVVSDPDHPADPGLLQGGKAGQADGLGQLAPKMRSKPLPLPTRFEGPRKVGRSRHHFLLKPAYRVRLLSEGLAILHGFSPSRNA